MKAEQRLKTVEAKTAVIDGKPIAVFYGSPDAGSASSFTDAGRAMLRGSAYKAVRILTDREENKRMSYIQDCLKTIVQAASERYEKGLPVVPSEVPLQDPGYKMNALPVRW